MKKSKNKLITLMIVLLMVLSGCSFEKTEDTPVAVAIVISEYQCGPKLDLSSVYLQELVSEAVSTYGYISIVCLDGNPEVVTKGSCDIEEQYKHADSMKLASDATARTLFVLNDIRNIKADSPEVDILEAIRVAADSLDEAPANSKKIILVMASGINTTGLCDFHNNIMNAEAEAVALALDEKKAIPDLDGIEVVWLHMGEVSSPQEDLSPRQKDHLNEIWEAIITHGGGTFTPKKATSSGEFETESLPVVTPVQLEQELPVSFDAEAMKNEENPFSEPTFLREEQVRFVADSDEFVNLEDAKSIISPIADYMINNPNFRILLIGTTAGDGANDYSISLSYSRAEAVKKALVELGVKENRIDVLGLGGTDPWHIPNVGTSGELAAQNRKVVILDADSYVAKEILR